MGTLINYGASMTSLYYGVNIIEVTPPGVARGTGTNVVAIVGHFPWGEPDVVHDIAGAGQLFDELCPLPFDVADDYASMKAFIGKKFPGLVKVVRISPSGAAAAAATYEDGAPEVSAESVTVTARWPGAVGDLIQITWSENAVDDTARDATVTIGTEYSVTYENVATINDDDELVVTDPGDPFVIFTAVVDAETVPEDGLAAYLSGGADGTPAAGDYTTALAALADVSQDFDVGFCAEPGAGIVDAVNDAVEAFAEAERKGVWVLSTPAAQAVATALTYPAARRSDRLVYTWPRVKTQNTYDPDRTEITVDGAAFAAAAIASVAPEISPGGAPGAPYLQGITGLEAGATRLQLEQLKAAGVTAWFVENTLGPIMYGGVTTSITAGRERILRRRMTDYIVASAAAYLVPYTGQKLDVDLEHQTLGEITGPEVKGLEAFLDQLERDQRIQAYELDPFGGNTSLQLAAGVFVILLAVRIYASQDAIVLRATIGEAVEITTT